MNSFVNFVDFAPFYTLQIEENTRKKQLELWKEYILYTLLQNKQYVIDLKSYPLFNNPKINNEDSRKTIFQYLFDSGNCEYINANSKDSIFLLPGPKNEIIKNLLEYLKSYNIKVDTFQSLIESPLCHDIVKKFFVQLQNEGKVVIIYNINGNGFKLL